MAINNNNKALERSTTLILSFLRRKSSTRVVTYVKFRLFIGVAFEEFRIFDETASGSVNSKLIWK